MQFIWLSFIKEVFSDKLSSGKKIIWLSFKVAITLEVPYDTTWIFKKKIKNNTARNQLPLSKALLSYLLNLAQKSAFI